MPLTTKNIPEIGALNGIEHFKVGYKGKDYKLNTEEFTKYASKLLSIDEIKEAIVTEESGYYGLLSNFYFAGGVATSSTITVDQIDTWLDVEMTVDTLGLNDHRPSAMQTAQSAGHTGNGSNGSPIVFDLEGLTLSASCNFRVSLSFTPDEDGGRLDSRMYVKRHSAAVPADDFFLEATGLSMESGADESYPYYVNIQFFIGDTINTNAAGDAGKIRFQVKSDVAGTISMNEMALFIQA